MFNNHQRGSFNSNKLFYFTSFLTLWCIRALHTTQYSFCEYQYFIFTVLRQQLVELLYKIVFLPYQKNHLL